MKKLIVLPSYNEKENILALIRALKDADPSACICVVDDNSPDQTHELVANFIKNESNKFPIEGSTHLIVRQKKDGRGGAVRTGIQFGISQGFDTFVEMDCDFSHPPSDLAQGFALLQTADVVLGSRYPDGKIVGWPWHRKVLSFFANQLARCLLSWQIHDYTNGFRFYNLRSAQLMIKMPQQHKGYIYLSETLSYFLKNKFNIKTFPIVFVNRHRGQSNTNFKEVSSALTGIFKIGWAFRFGKG
jgi:dolichol-phosphate mannosyltransferase